MSSRRKSRPRYVDEGRPTFTPGMLINMAVLIGGFLTTAAAFYYGTRDHFDALDKTTSAQQIAHEKLTSEFLSNSQKTAEGIATLNTHAAVQDEQTKNIASSLATISTQLGSLSLASGKGH